MIAFLLFANLGMPCTPHSLLTPSSLGVQSFKVQTVNYYVNGIEVHFSKPLLQGIGVTPEDYSLLVEGSSGEGASRWIELPIMSTLVSPDRERVFLYIPDFAKRVRSPMRLELSRAIFSEELSPLSDRLVELSLVSEPRERKVVALPLAMPNTLTPEERSQGFRHLFDGVSFSGWRGYRRETVPSTWVVQDGAMVVVPGSGGGDIITTEEFQDFELRLQWKISPRGNSGIFFRVSEKGRFVWETGPEMQILDDEGYGASLDPKTAAGADYALYAPLRRVTRAVGKWNDVRIIVKGSHVEYWLNGHKVVEYELGSEDWLNRVKASKFANLPDFGRVSKGHIALQDHGFPVWFRNIRIRPL